MVPNVTLLFLFQAGPTALEYAMRSTLMPDRSGCSDGGLTGSPTAADDQSVFVDFRMA